MQFTGKHLPAALYRTLVALALLAAAAYALLAPGHESQAQSPVPAAPTGLTAASVSNDSVALSWDDPGDDSITGYQVLRRSRDGDEYGGGQGAAAFVAVVDDTGSAAASYTDTSVTSRTRYVYRVKAISAEGLSERSSYLNVETPAAPVSSTSGPANAEGACNGTLTIFSPTFDDCARQVLSARHSVAVEAVYDEVRSRGRVRLTVNGGDLLDSFNGIEVRDVTTYFQVVRRNVDNPVHRQVSGSGSVTVDVPTGYAKYYIYATLFDGENQQVKFLVSGESTSFLEASQQAPPTIQTAPTPTPSPRGIERLTLHESHEAHRLDWAIEPGDGAAPTRFRIARRYHSGYQPLGSDDVAQANDPERGFCYDTTRGWLFNFVGGGTRSVTFPIDPPWLQHGRELDGVRWTDLRARDLYTVTPVYGDNGGDKAIVFSSSCTASLNSEEAFPRRRWTSEGGGATRARPRYRGTS